MTKHIEAEYLWNVGMLIFMVCALAIAIWAIAGQTIWTIAAAVVGVLNFWSWQAMGKQKRRALNGPMLDSFVDGNVSKLLREWSGESKEAQRGRYAAETVSDLLATVHLITTIAGAIGLAGGIVYAMLS